MRIVKIWCLIKPKPLTDYTHKTNKWPKIFTNQSQKSSWANMWNKSILFFVLINFSPDSPTEVTCLWILTYNGNLFYSFQLYRGWSYSQKTGTNQGNFIINLKSQFIWITFWKTKWHLLANDITIKKSRQFVFFTASENWTKHTTTKQLHSC